MNYIPIDLFLEIFGYEIIGILDTSAIVCITFAVLFCYPSNFQTVVSMYYVVLYI